MSDKRLDQDASSSIAGIIYQFYITVEKCFELSKGKKLHIEKYGDITVNGEYQIEVKKFKDNLTDSHKNLWNTINNWLKEDFFPES